LNSQIEILIRRVGASWSISPILSKLWNASSI